MGQMKKKLLAKASLLKWKWTEQSDESVSHLFYLDDMEILFQDKFPFKIKNPYLVYLLALPKILNTCLFSEPRTIELPGQFKYLVKEEWFAKTIRQVYNYSILFGARPEYPQLKISSGQAIKKIWMNTNTKNNQLLSLLSFGKDSLLNTILAKTIGYNVSFLTCRDELFGEEYHEQLELKMFQQRQKAVKYITQKYGLKGYFFSTKLYYIPLCDKYNYLENVPALNVLNAYVGALPFCEEYGYGTISAGNDYACNLDVYRRLGVTLHYNLGKTVWFMRLFRRFLRSLNPNLRLFSFVEPFVDWETQVLLATIDPEVIPFQTSCDDALCNNCEKCLMMWLVFKILGYDFKLNGLKEMTREQMEKILTDSPISVLAGVAWCLKYLNLLNSKKIRLFSDLYNFSTINARIEKCGLPLKTKAAILNIVQTIRLRNCFIPSSLN
ncbi:MAG: hypothetical protein V1915_02405 [Candidatus Bathyarchaeota archaeon]